MSDPGSDFLEPVSLGLLRRLVVCCLHRLLEGQMPPMLIVSKSALKGGRMSQRETSTPSKGRQHRTYIVADPQRNRILLVSSNQLTGGPCYIRALYRNNQPIRLDAVAAISTDGATFCRAESTQVGPMRRSAPDALLHQRATQRSVDGNGPY